MFRLERPVVLFDHQSGYITHHLGIAVHLALAAEALVEDEVVVALEGMTIDAGIVVAMIGNEALQLHSCLGQTLNGEGHILDETRGADGTCTAHRGEDARADGPVLAVDGRIFSKLCGDVQPELRETLFDALYLLEQLLVRCGFRLGEDGRQVVIVTRCDSFYLTGIDIFLILQVDRVVDRAERLVVEHLCTLHHQPLGTHQQIVVAGKQFLHSHNGLAALLHRHEIDHRRCLEGIVAERLHRHLREEGQRTLRTHHRVGHDVERVVVGDEGSQVESGDVLDAVLLPDACHQLFVSTHTVAQLFYLTDEVGVRLSELLAALLVGCINDGAVGEDDARALHHTVAVGVDTTVHARGVVADDTTHHSRTDAGRVRRKDAPVGLQYLVDTGSHDARLQPDAHIVERWRMRSVQGRMIYHLMLFPMLSCYDEHRVAHTLP